MIPSECMNLCGSAGTGCGVGRERNRRCAPFLKPFLQRGLDQKDKDVKETKDLLKVRNRLVYDVTSRLEKFSLNTVVSGFMEYNNKLNDMAKKGGVDKKDSGNLHCAAGTFRTSYF